LAKYPHISIYGSEADRGRIPGQKVFLNDGDKVEFSGRYADVFFLPGHTLGHIAYYFPPQKDRDFGELFSGDVIFGSGCGRIKEGTPAQMVESMGKLRQLPDNTRIWCAHEYTLNNLEFSLTIEPENQDLQARYRETKIARSRHEPTVPLLLEIEKRTNPFLRWDVPSVQEAVSQTDPARVFGRLRGKKDLF
jgi:hydroxyacylglutathione hydrolase